MEFVAGCNRRSWLACERELRSVELTWLLAGWLEWSYVELLHCIAMHIMACYGVAGLLHIHSTWCVVCVVAVVFFIANISLCLPYSYLIAILMLNIKLYVCSVPTTFLHTNNNRNIHMYIVSHLLWRSYSGGNYYYHLYDVVFIFVWILRAFVISVKTSIRSFLHFFLFI